MSTSTPARLYRVRLSCGCVLKSRFGEHIVPEPGDLLRCWERHGGMPQTVESVVPVDDEPPATNEGHDGNIWSE